MHAPVVATLNGTFHCAITSVVTDLCRPRSQPTTAPKGPSWYDNGTWSLLFYRLGLKVRSLDIPLNTRSQSSISALKGLGVSSTSACPLLEHTYR
jgi:hypothetical protein